MNSFEELVSIRYFLQDFSHLHYPSIHFFYSAPGPSFRLFPSEGFLGSGLYHLTTTATCIDSLLDCPDKFNTRVSSSVLHLDELAKTYAEAALAREAKGWISEGSAPIYCRCRGLPLAITYTAVFQVALKERVEEIFRQMDNLDRLAIGEAVLDVDRGEHEADEKTWYPPNAFHSYWALDILERFRGKYPTEYTDAAGLYNLANKRRLILLWARQQLGVQIALHCANSAKRDTDQLAWALAIHCRFTQELSILELEQDLVRKGLECLFTAQEPNGSWKHYGPLFHYRNAGNAYCYVFETFAALLRNALAPAGLFLRSALQSYLDNLSQLARYAFETRMPLSDDSATFGWSSGHHPHRSEPEAWATASVFSFVQALRRLVGVWTKEAALKELPQRNHDRRTPNEAAVLLKQRGDVWRAKGTQSVGQDLVTRFVNPVFIHASGGSTELEPDKEVLDKDQYRSAILFGPPGTSKTTLVHAVADRIGWNYVELHAGDFVAEGLPNVQRTTDLIFRRLMELDRCVVLFDEIDELVRRREGETDAFGRFLTTSMLPRLAELWQQRKVIYFVASNHIEYFDQAVIRGQRFDVLLWVPPPSFEQKTGRLRELLNNGLDSSYTFATGIRQEAFDEALKRVVERATTAMENQNDQNHSLSRTSLNESEWLAKFIFLRWDQLPELASRIRKMGGENRTLTKDLLRRCLGEVKDQRLDYLESYVEYRRDQAQARYDFGMVTVWKLEIDKADISKRVGVKEIGDETWISCQSHQNYDALLRGFQVTESPEELGTLRVTVPQRRRVIKKS